MNTSRDSSLWRSIAVAFGDGVAFGVGMKMTQNAARRSGEASRLEQMEERLRQIECSSAPVPGDFDQRIVEGLVQGVEARLQEQAASVDRRLADLETRVAVEMKALNQQDRGNARAIEESIESLRGQILALHREFAAQVARIVGEQVDQAVEKRFARFEDRLAPLREELERKNQEIAELRTRTRDTDAAVFDFVASMGQMCRETAEKLGGPKETAPPPTPVPPSPPSPEAQTPDPLVPDATASETAEASPPSFGELKRPAGLWRIPMVSSLIVAAGGAALLAHYL